MKQKVICKIYKEKRTPVSFEVVDNSYTHAVCKCYHCRQWFEITKHRFLNGAGYYCSRACKDTFSRKESKVELLAKRDGYVNDLNNLEIELRTREKQFRRNQIYKKMDDTVGDILYIDDKLAYFSQFKKYQ